jgi:hypothetical protein
MYEVQIMETKETLEKLAGFIDGLVAEQVAQSKSEETITLDKAIKVILDTRESEANDEDFQKLLDLTRELAKRFDFVATADIDVDWVKNNTELLDGDGQYIDRDDVDADWVEDHTDILDDYIKKDYDDIVEYVKEDCDVLQFVHEVTR